MPPRRKALPNPLPDGVMVTDTEKKSWRLGKVIGSGGFGMIYLASQSVDAPVKDDTHFVLKVEYHENGPLFSELKFYQRAAKPESMQKWKRAKGLDFLGIPTYWGSGLFEHKGTRYRFMAMDRLGTDLQKVLEKSGGSFPKHTVLELGCLMLDVLEYIHDNEYVHADIKAANLLLDVKQPGKVYLADYGLAYRYNPGGVHKEYKENPKKGHNGTIEYTSTDAHKGVAPSRRGDLEILGYCLLHWLSGTLPWLSVLRDPAKVQEAKAKLMSNLPDSVTQLCGSAAGSAELGRFMVRVKSLGYMDRPDYQALKKILMDGVPQGSRGQGLLDLHRARPQKGPEPSAPKPAGQAKPPARRPAKPKTKPVVPAAGQDDVSDEDSPKTDLRRAKPPARPRGQASRPAKPAAKKITTVKPAIQKSPEEDDDDDDYAESEESEEGDDDDDDVSSDEEQDTRRGAARGRGTAGRKKTAPARRRPYSDDSDEDYDPGPEYRAAQAQRGASGSAAAAAVDSLCPALEKTTCMPKYPSRRRGPEANVPRTPSSQYGRRATSHPATAQDKLPRRKVGNNGHGPVYYPPSSNHHHNHWTEYSYDHEGNHRRNHSIRGHSYQYTDPPQGYPACATPEDNQSTSLNSQVQKQEGRYRWFSTKVLGGLIVLVAIAVVLYLKVTKWPLKSVEL